MSILAASKRNYRKQDQIPKITSFDRIEVFVYKVETIAVSMSLSARSHPEMIKRLMEQVYDNGTSRKS